MDSSIAIPGSLAARKPSKPNELPDRTTVSRICRLSLHPDDAMSIVHRITGIALYFGTLLLAWWLISRASGPTAYANVQAFTSSFIGRLIVFAIPGAAAYLLSAQHFVWTSATVQGERT